MSSIAFCIVGVRASRVEASLGEWYGKGFALESYLWHKHRLSAPRKSRVFLESSNAQRTYSW